MHHRKVLPEERYLFNERIAIMLESAGLPIDTPKMDVPKEIRDTAIQENLDRLQAVSCVFERNAGLDSHLGRDASGSK